MRSYVADPGRPPPVAAGGPTPHPDVAMWRAVCRLAPRRRAAIVLRYDEGLSEEHAAARMDTTPRLLRADVDAAMLTLRTAVPGVADPWTRVADALAAAGRGWSDYTRPAAARVAEVLSAPATPAPRPARDPRTGPPPRARPRSARPVALAAGAVAALLLAAAVVVPRLGGDDPAPAGPGPVAAAPRPGIGARRPATGGARHRRRRGPAQLAGTGSAGRRPDAAGRGHERLEGRRARGRGAGERGGRAVGRHARPPRGRGPAGPGPRRPAAPGAGRGRDGARAMRLQHAEPLHGGTQVLTLLPPAGPSGPVRVLVSPEAQVADGLLASNPMDGKPLQHIAARRRRGQRHPAVAAGRADLQPGRPARSRPGQSRRPAAPRSSTAGS